MRHQQQLQQPPQRPIDSDILHEPKANVELAHNLCETGMRKCVGEDVCIRAELWCDSMAQCQDASDETNCSCLSRLEKNKICDGYGDCPFDVDEAACFGCGKCMHSCYSSRDEHDAGSGNACFSSEQRCDGVANCANERDEQGCSVVAKKLGFPDTEGSLYRIVEGDWHFVCFEQELEIGQQVVVHGSNVKLIQKGGFGSYVKLSKSGDVIKGSACGGNGVLNFSPIAHVECPEPECGLKNVTTHLDRIRRTNKEPFVLQRANVDFESIDKDVLFQMIGALRVGRHKWSFVVFFVQKRSIPM